MSNIKKLMVSAAGGAGLDVDEVFSTYLYTGNSGNQTITTGLDMTGEGGMTWFKTRNHAGSHLVFDTVRGQAERLMTDSASNQDTQAAGRFPTFTSTGFTLANDTGGDLNYSGRTAAAWSFRKAPKFFDIVTYTGNGVLGRQIAHNLGCDVGMLLVKPTNQYSGWSVWHNSFTGTAKYGTLNTADEIYSSGESRFGNTSTSIDPTSSNFTVSTVLNDTGSTYVAYLFAHNDGDGEFGPDGDQDIIKCGSYTGNGSADGPQIDLGFEPQWVLTKSSASGNWLLTDTMRGFTTEGDSDLHPNLTYAEGVGLNYRSPNASGFKVNASYPVVNASGSTYIYMAIRRGSLNVPENATDVFAIDTWGGGTSSQPMFTSGFPVDFAMWKNTGGSNTISTSRLTGKFNYMDSSLGANAEGSTSYLKYDYMNGWGNNTSSVPAFYSWMWKRAPGFFDVAAYKGDGASTRTVKHNLGVVPEMMWHKHRDGNDNWTVYHKDLAAGKVLFLNKDNSLLNRNFVNATQTASDFTVVGSGNPTNQQYALYLNYLFATLPGISKVGSFSHTYGGTTNVDCGFTSGARFVLWKRIDGDRHWEVFDTTRGIVAGNDAYLRLSDTIAETSGDFIDPYSAGFSVGSALGTGEFIFYAIA